MLVKMQGENNMEIKLDNLYFKYNFSNHIFHAVCV